MGAKAARVAKIYSLGVPVLLSSAARLRNVAGTDFVVGLSKSNLARLTVRAVRVTEGRAVARLKRS
jgi:hypothetical protein